MGIDVRNMLIIFEIGIKCLMLMSHPYKEYQMLKMCFLSFFFFCEVDHGGKTLFYITIGGIGEYCPYS